jgi:two-component system nitrogen regulation sensor histidine kinase NtrY
MLLRQFLLRVIVLVVLIALTGLLVVWSFNRESLVIARFTFIVAWLILIILLIYYVTKTNRTLKVFMNSLRYLDKVRIRKGKGRLFEELDMIYNEVLGMIHKVELEKETDRRYFKSIIDHAGTGILVFDESGNIITLNSAFNTLLGVRSIDNIQRLSSVSLQLPGILMSTKPGHHRLLRISVNTETVGLWLKMAEIRINEKKYRLASVQNIQHELEDEEVEAWQKLIKVLTHEIMNSITPVNSLTNTIIRMLEKDGQPRDLGEVDRNTLKNVLEGLHSIEKRNKGLIGFVQSYRSLTRIQKPAFSNLAVNDLLIRIAGLVKHEAEMHNIVVIVNISRNPLILNADEKLVEQVLINLLNNAIYALRDAENREIQLAARSSHEEILIEVTDNGEGIPPELIGNIFVPFFTTKAEGSGIGLSLSRQIMRIHNGAITVKSRPGETIFILRFPRP